MNTYPDTHSKVIGYLLWIFGFTGSHRFYFGKPITGTIWFFTGGLLLIGWIIDLFLIPSMDRKADRRFVQGPTDYSVAWLLLTFLGFFGVHRFYMGKWGRPDLPGHVWAVRLGLPVRPVDPQPAGERGESGRAPAAFTGAGAGRNQCRGVAPAIEHSISINSHA